ncbi:MAG: DMT family transporter [Trueperaceae bacterium]|nr:DMT family transporter [Trueperaceae bacterium]
MPYRPSGITVALVLATAVVAISFAAIFARLAEAPGVVVAFWRMTFATLLLAPLARRGLRRTPPTATTLRPAALAGLLLGIHFATWLSSLAYTTVAASVTLVTTAPIWVALIEWVQGRRPHRGVLIGLATAVAGGVVIGLGDLRGGAAPLLGDALALVGAISVAGYYLLGRHAQRAGLSTGAYAGVAYGVAALVLVPVPYLFDAAYLAWPAATWVWIVLMAVAPQLVGHTGLNWANRHVDPTLVATATLLEPVGAGVLAWLVFAEAPGPGVVAGAPVVLLGLALVIRNRRPPPPGPMPAGEPGGTKLASEP